MVYYKYKVNGETCAFISESEERANRVVDMIMAHGALVTDFEFISEEEYNQLKTK